MSGSVSPPGTRGTAASGSTDGALFVRPWPSWLSYGVPIGMSALLQIVPAIVLVRASVLAGPALGVPPRQALLALALAVVGPVGLIFARRAPGPVVAIVAAASAIDLIVGPGSGPPYVALAFASVGAIVRGARLWAWIAVGAAWTVTLVVTAVLGHSGWTPFRILGMTLGILIVMGIGELIGARRDRAIEMQNLMRQRHLGEVREERSRIARELHDVLAHSLSQINVQASVGLHLIDRQPEKASEALAAIKDTSKSALDEVRAVLGLLDADDGGASAPLIPEPDLSRLAELATNASADGLSVELEDQLDHAQMPGPVQLALYRVVQESLTNIRRHATGATRVQVILRVDDGEVLLDVLDDGAASARARESGGRGLLGMRERAELLGGRLTAGPAADGGFHVSARIPLERPDSPGRTNSEPA